MAFLITSCLTLPKNPETLAEQQIKACLPNAIIMSQALNRQDVWAKTLIIKWKENNKFRGHAYSIYLYPPGTNKLWAYDRDYGSTRVRAYKTNAKSVGQYANKSRGLYEPLTIANYLD